MNTETRSNGLCFTPRWFRIEFRPLVLKAKKAGIDPKVQDRFLQWISDHKNPDVSCLRGTILDFMRNAGSAYDDFVNDAIVG